MTRTDRQEVTTFFAGLMGTYEAYRLIFQEGLAYAGQAGSASEAMVRLRNCEYEAAFCGVVETLLTSCWCHYWNTGKDSDFTMTELRAFVLNQVLIYVKDVWSETPSQIEARIWVSILADLTPAGSNLALVVATPEDHVKNAIPTTVTA